MIILKTPAACYKGSIFVETISSASYLLTTIIEVRDLFHALPGCDLKIAFRKPLKSKDFITEKHVTRNVTFRLSAE